MSKSERVLFSEELCALPPPLNRTVIKQSLTSSTLWRDWSHVGTVMIMSGGADLSSRGLLIGSIDHVDEKRC